MYIREEVFHQSSSRRESL